MYTQVKQRQVLARAGLTLKLSIFLLLPLIYTTLEGVTLCIAIYWLYVVYIDCCMVLYGVIALTLNRAQKSYQYLLLKIQFACQF